MSGLSEILKDVVELCYMKRLSLSKSASRVLVKFGKHKTWFLSLLRKNSEDETINPQVFDPINHSLNKRLHVIVFSSDAAAITAVALKRPVSKA